MSKDQINQFDSTASNNTDIEGINTSETMMPSNVQDAIRSMMSLLKKQEVGTHAMTSPDINGGTVDGAVIGGATPAAGTFTDVTATGTGNRSVTITSSDALATMEIGGTTGSFIDLKTPSSDDFDVRLSGGATGGSIQIAGGSFSISGSGETLANFTDDGGVTLYNDNTARLVTTSVGAEITGDLSIASTVDSDNADLGEINFWNKTNAGSGSGTSFVNDVAAIQGQMEGTGNNSGGSLHFYTKSDGGSKTEAVTIDGSQQVGIGAAASAGKLHVTNSTGTIGYFESTQSATNAANLVGNSTQTNSSANLVLQINGGTTAQALLRCNGDNSMAFFTGASPAERMRLNSTGLGIGTTAASELLHLSGSNCGMRLEEPGGYDWRINNDGGNLNFSSDDPSAWSDKMTLTNDGNLLHQRSSNSITGTSINEMTLGSGSGQYGVIVDVGSGSGYYGFAKDGTYNSRIRYDYTSSFMALDVNSAERVRINSDGKVAINKTTSTEFLEVHGAIGSSHSASNFGAGDARANIDFATGAGGTRIGSVNGNYGLVFLANSGEKARINSNGDLIVGGTASTVLNASGADVQGKFIDVQPGTAVAGGVVVGSTGRGGTTSADYRQGYFLRRSDGWSTSQSGMWKGSHSTGSNINYWERMKIGNSGGGGHIDFEINDDTKMTLRTDGKLAIGNDAPAELLDVSGAIKSRGVIAANTQQSCAFGYQFDGWRSIAWGPDASTRGIYRLEQYEGDGGGGLLSQSASTAGVWSADYNDTSDRNLKKNIEPLSSSIEIVKALNPVSFDWKNEAKGSNSGFIAQELQEVLPDEVTGTEFDPDTEFPDTAMAINTTGIVAHLTKALQESMEKIEALEARITILEGE